MATATHRHAMSDPPHDTLAERAILGSILLDADLLAHVSGRLRPADMYRRVHELVLTAMLALDEAGDPVDTIGLMRHLSADPLFRQAGGPQWLFALTNDIPAAEIAHVTSWCASVRDCAARRKLVEMGERLAHTAATAAGAPGIVESLEGELVALALAHDLDESSGLRPVRGALDEAISDIELAHERGDGLVGMATGYADFDRLTGGLEPGKVYVIQARPGMGKTAMLLGMCEGLAVDRNLPVGAFSLEMKRSELAHRMMCSRARVSSQRVQRGGLTDDEWGRLIRAAADIAKSPLFVDDPAQLTIAQLIRRTRAWLRKVRRDVPEGDPSRRRAVVAVDYMQITKGEGTERTEHEAVGNVSKGLKMMAKALDVAVIALAQTKRAVEDRTDKRPRKGDLGNSGQIERDADLIAGIYRDEVYNPDTPDVGIAELIIDKQRSGPTGTVMLKWFGAYTRFETLNNDPARWMP